MALPVAGGEASGSASEKPLPVTEVQEGEGAASESLVVREVSVARREEVLASREEALREREEAAAVATEVVEQDRQPEGSADGDDLLARENVAARGGFASELAEREAELAEREARLVAEVAALAERKSASTEREARHAAVESESAERAAALAGLRAKLADREADLEKIREESARPSAVAEELRAKLAEREAELEKLREESAVAEELREKLAAREAELERLREESARPSALAEGHEAKLAEREAELEKLREENSQRTTEATRLEVELASRETEVVGLRGELASLQAEQSGSNAELEGLRPKLLEREQEVAKLREESSSLRAEAERLRIDLAEREAEPATQGESAEPHHEVEALRAALTSREAELARLRSGSSGPSEATEGGRVGADIALDRDRLREELARRSSALQASEEQLWQANETAQKERIENVRLVSEVDRLREQVERGRGVERDRLKEIESLGHELRRLEVAHAEVQGLLEGKAQRVRELEDAARGVGAVVDSDIERLRAELRTALTDLERSRSREHAGAESARRREREVADAQETISQLRRAVDDYAATAANLRGELVVIQVEVEQLQTLVPTLHAQVSALREKLSARDDEAATLQQKLESAADEQQHLRKRLRERKRSEEELAATHGRVVAQAEGLRAELEAVKQVRVQLDSAALEDSEGAPDLRQELAVQAQRFADELGRIEARREEILKTATVRLERAQLEAHVRAEEQEFLLFRVDASEQRIWEMSDAADRNAARLAAGLAQYAKQKEQLEDLVHELEVTRDLLAEAESRVGELERSVASERARLARQGLDGGGDLPAQSELLSAPTPRSQPDTSASVTVDAVFAEAEFEDPLHLDDELLRMTDAILDGEAQLVQTMVTPRSDDEYDRELEEILAGGDDLESMPSLGLGAPVDDELLRDVEAAMASSRSVRQVDDLEVEPEVESVNWGDPDSEGDDTGIIIEMLDDEEWPGEWGEGGGVGSTPSLLSTDTGSSDDYIDIDLFDVEGDTPSEVDAELDVEFDLAEEVDLEEESVVEEMPSEVSDAGPVVILEEVDDDTPEDAWGDDAPSGLLVADDDEDEEVGDLSEVDEAEKSLGSVDGEERTARAEETPVEEKSAVQADVIVPGAPLLPPPPSVGGADLELGAAALRALAGPPKTTRGLDVSTDDADDVFGDAFDLEVPILVRPPELAVSPTAQEVEEAGADEPADVEALAGLEVEDDAESSLESSVTSAISGAALRASEGTAETSAEEDAPGAEVASAEGLDFAEEAEDEGSDASAALPIIEIEDPPAEIDVEVEFDSGDPLLSLEEGEPSAEEPAFSSLPGEQIVEIDLDEPESASLTEVDVEVDVDLGGLDEVEIDVTVVEAQHPGVLDDEVEIDMDMDEIDIDMDVGADIAEVAADGVEIEGIEIDEVEIDEVEIDEVEIDEVEIDEVEIGEVELDEVEIDAVEIEEVDAEEVDAVEAEDPDESGDGELLSGASLFMVADEEATSGIPADEEPGLDLVPIGVPLDDDEDGPSLDLGSVGIPLDDDEEPL